MLVNFYSLLFDKQTHLIHLLGSFLCLPRGKTKILTYFSRKLKNQSYFTQGNLPPHPSIVLFYKTC